MAEKSLVIVESPAKAKTIGKFLGSKYKVIASVGHVRDLPKSKMGINIENNFEPQYINIRGKGDVIKELKKEAKKAKKVILATDPDREGEAISWHIAQILDINKNDKCRIEFNEITKNAITSAVKSPRQIDMGLVDAQQARRVLDRLVGYSISPLLWKKIKRGLSAGRVQSAALKIICDREKEILSFIPTEYWTITALLYSESAKSQSFEAKLSEYKGKKIEINNKEEAENILASLDKTGFRITKVEKKERIRKPLPPFTTSSLQQEASNRLGFFTNRTMMIAQQLYEGIDIPGEGTIGLITYIRTDSVRVSNEAREAAKEYIEKNYTKEYIGNNVYSNRKKDTQDAHEAIRPTYITLHPDNIKGALTNDQYKLYKLIWERYTASQMSNAIYDSSQVEIMNNDYTFKASGSQLKFDGFLKVYSFSEANEKMLPDMYENQILECKGLLPEQHFTQPPSRFTEASLVKELEEKNIGRPSTYVPIISTLVTRKYIKRDKKSLFPTELGFVVTDLMENYFNKIVDVGFTADLEEKLDDIESEIIDWKKVVEDFYRTFKKELDEADDEIRRIEIQDELTDEICENCGKPMAIKQGRFGEFLACSGYPECKNTRPIVNKTGVLCPECGNEIVERRSKKGKIFYGCNGYPNCNFILWNKPIDKKCPKCQSLLIQKKMKNSNFNFQCSNTSCDYKE
ncbi:MAG: type I DNA topoisomerase [Clostridiales bacterium]|nr:type I DNA topoisomerase [Clostridiales bacterium]